MKGSQKHIQSLIGSPNKIDTLIQGSGFCLADQPHLVPTGEGDGGAKEMSLETYLEKNPISDLKPIAKDWWVKSGKRPTWDLLAHVKREDRTGLLIVEAKAHERELATLTNIGSFDDENQKQIRRRIKEVQGALNKLNKTKINLTNNLKVKHYQLINRLAYSLHLAQQGYNVILLYLGFLEDTDFKNHFLNDLHWQRAMGGYLEGAVSQRFPEVERKIDDAGTLRMMIRSIEVSELEVAQ